MTDRLSLQARNGFLTAILCCLAMHISLPSVARSDEAFSPNPASHVINDTAAGLALFGYDPVAYHTDQRAIEGKAEFDTMHQNLIWRFTSAANREAFLFDPSAYIPAFGGHDALSVSQGRMTMGDPTTFLVVRGTVILFRSQDHREQFSVTDDVLKTAHARWPVVVRQHASH